MHLGRCGARVDCRLGVPGYVQRFRGGLVFKAHRLCESLNSRLESNKEESTLVDAAPASTAVVIPVLLRERKSVSLIHIPADFTTKPYHKADFTPKLSSLYRRARITAYE